MAHAMPSRAWSAKRQSGPGSNPVWIKSWLIDTIIERSARAGRSHRLHNPAMKRTDQLFTPAGSRLRTVADAVALLGEGLRSAPVERLRLAHLDDNGTLIAMTEQTGDHHMLPLRLRDIAGEAFARQSQRLLIAHNHPSGDPTPSRADLEGTRRLAELLRPLEIALVDHLVIARDGVTSFRQLGLL